MTTGSRAVINYSQGAIGNRLLPLSSAYAISKTENRELYQVWSDSLTSNGTLAHFRDLFLNEIKELSSKNLSQLNEFVIYNRGSIQRLSSRYGLEDLSHMSKRGEVRPVASYEENRSVKNVIIYSDNMVQNSCKKLCQQFIKSLRPIPAIQKKIDLENGLLNLSKDIVGVHARGTDFMEAHGFDVSYYLNKMKSYDSSVVFFLSTDDPSCEDVICHEFKGRVLTRDRAHLVKSEDGQRWSYNFTITKELSQDAIVDIYLLSETSIEVYHPESTFCQLAKMLK